MIDLVTFGTGTAAGVIAMLPTGIVLCRSVARARRERHIETERRKLAELVCGDAQNRATLFANERNAATAHLTDALAKIVEMEPFAKAGRIAMARQERQNARRRAGLAK